MGMSAGTVTVSDDGSVTKSGMAEAIYDALLVREQQNAVQFGVEIPSGSDGAKAKKAIGQMATAIAGALVNYMQANAKAVITTSTAGLQRTPNPNNANTATVAPATQQELAIS